MNHKRPVTYIIKKNKIPLRRNEDYQRIKQDVEGSKGLQDAPLNASITLNITTIKKLIVQGPIKRIKSAVVEKNNTKTAQELFPDGIVKEDIKKRFTLNMRQKEADEHSLFSKSVSQSASTPQSFKKNFLIRKKKSSFSDSQRFNMTPLSSRATTRESEGAHSLANDKREEDYIDKLFEDPFKVDGQLRNENSLQANDFCSIIEENIEKQVCSDSSCSKHDEATSSMEKSDDFENKIVLKKDSQVSFEVKLGDMIGEGACGQVYKALSTETGQFMAAKHIKNSDLSKKSIDGLVNLCQEITLYQKLDHQNIVRYLGAKQIGLDTYIYMEYMPGGSISSMLKQYGSFDELLIRKFTKQMVLGLDYLHSKGVIHRDIKGGNIMSDGCGNVKLADFGASKHIEDYSAANSNNSEICESIKGSLFWMAPELINQEKHGRKIDIWSLGCTVIEMASANHPWPNVKSLPQLIIAILTQKCPPIPQNLSECAKNFIKECCQFDKNLRPRAKDLLKHPFLN